MRYLKATDIIEGHKVLLREFYSDELIILNQNDFGRGSVGYIVGVQEENSYGEEELVKIDTVFIFSGPNKFKISIDGTIEVRLKSNRDLLNLLEDVLEQQKSLYNLRGRY